MRDDASDSGPLRLVLEVLGVALAALVVALALPGTQGPGPEQAAARIAAPHAALAIPGIRIRGGPELSALTRNALQHLLATPTGARIRERLTALPGPVTIEINAMGDDYTPYRVPGGEIGERIVFDPWTLPLVKTERGPVRATRESVLAHELGHAVLKLRSEQDVIREVENPIRLELGLPRRVAF